MTFEEWAYKELATRGWDQAELSRRGDITSSHVSRILSGLRKPGPEACSAIARAFNIPEDIVFRKAGLMSPAPENTDALAEAHHLFAKLSDDDQEMLLAQMHAIVELRERREEYTLRQTT